MFGAVSGAHLNPVVTLIDRAFGGIRHPGGRALHRRPGRRRLPRRCTGQPHVRPARHRPVDHGPVLRRAVAVRGRSPPSGSCSSSTAASAPAGATSSPSPSVSGSAAPTSSRPRPASPTPPSPSPAPSPTPSPASQPSSAPMFIVMQLVGAAVAYALIRILFPRPPTEHQHRGAANAGHLRADGRPATVLEHRRAAPGEELDDVPVVLFLCVHNAGRCQMALGWFQRLAGDRAVAWSGGSEPGRRGQPGRRRGDGRGRHRHHRGVPQALDRRDRPGRRRRRSPWAAATPVRSSRASATRTGRSTTPQDRTSEPSDRSGTRSSVGSESSSTRSESGSSRTRTPDDHCAHEHPIQDQATESTMMATCGG